jgi:hypothetical protein
VLNLKDDETQDGHAKSPAAVLVWIGVVRVGSEEGREIRSGLGDDEVIDVEEFTNAMQRRLAVAV